jgi:hypothetical protein
MPNPCPTVLDSCICKLSHVFLLAEARPGFFSELVSSTLVDTEISSAASPDQFSLLGSVT